MVCVVILWLLFCWLIVQLLHCHSSQLIPCSLYSFSCFVYVAAHKVKEDKNAGRKKTNPTDCFHPFNNQLFSLHFFNHFQLLPSSGAGAVNAMQDAVLLANHIYDIKPTSFENIKRALCDYKEERFDAIKDQYPQSYVAAKLIYGHVSLKMLPVAFLFTPCSSVYDAKKILKILFLFSLLVTIENRLSRSEHYDKSCLIGCPSRCR